jgi:hypothetical protein
MSPALIVTIIVLALGALGIVLYLRKHKAAEPEKQTTMTVKQTRSGLPIRASDAQALGEREERMAARRRRAADP